MPNGPTLPVDVKDPRVMRAWYQALLRSLQNLGVQGTANQIDVTNGTFDNLNVATISLDPNLILNGFTLTSAGNFAGHELQNADITVGNTLVTLVSKLKERVSVKDYGAIGNGSTDDTAAFTAAIAGANAANKALYIPTGTYKISSTLTIANPLEVIGDGPGASIIKPYLPVGGGDLFLVTSSDVSFADFCFDGSGITNPVPTSHVYMIDFTPVSGTILRGTVRNVRFNSIQFSKGVYLTDPTANLRVAHCIKAHNINNVTIENCFAKSISGSFVYTSGVSYLQIAKNYIEDCLWYPIRLNDTTNYFNIIANVFVPVDTGGPILGGLIDVASVSGSQCAYGNIQANLIYGFDDLIGDNYGYVGYGSVIRVMSSTNINITDNVINHMHDGTNNGNNYVFNELAYIRVGTAGTSSGDQNGPCKNINIAGNQFNAGRKLTNIWPVGVIVTNDFQASTIPAIGIKILDNQMMSTSVGSGQFFTHGITLNGNSSGLQDIIIENNTITAVPTNATTGATHPTQGRGIVSVVSTNSTGLCDKIFIGGNHIENIDGASAGGNVTYSCLVVGQYTANVINTKPNWLEGGYSAVVIESGATGNLMYLDNQFAENQLHDTYEFNVQPTCYHTSVHGSTASRPSSTGGRVNYMSYFDTDLGQPVWYNGSSWVDAVGSTSGTTFPLSLAKGGTNAALTASNGGLFYSTASAGAILSGTPTAGQILRSGSSSAPAWSTATFADTYTSHNLLYASGTNTVAGASTLTYDGTTLVVGTPDTMTLNGSVITSTVETNSDTQAIVEAHTHSSAAAGVASVYYMARSRGTTASPTIVQSGDTLGYFGAVGYDGTDMSVGGRINFVVGTTPGNDNMPTNMVFQVSPSGSETPVTSMTLKYDGSVQFTNSITAGTWAGTAIGVTAGGTGLTSTTANQLLYSSATSTIAGLATAANGVLVTDGSSVPSISSTLPSAVQGNITSVGTVSSGTWSASTIAVNKGGTGQTSYTNGQLLIGNTSGNTLTKATLTQGSGITITNGNGSITIASTAATDYSGIQRSWMGI